MKNNRPSSRQNDLKTKRKMRQSTEQSNSNKDGDEHIEGLAALLQEERTPVQGTLPLTTFFQTPIAEVDNVPLNCKCRKALQNCVTRTLTRNWRHQKFPRTQKELSISSVMENIGRVMHPVEIVLTMHSRILEERKINLNHPVLVKRIAELTAFPPKYPSPPLKSGKSPIHPIQQQFQTLEFVTAQSTPNPRRYSLRNDSVMHLSHSVEVPSDRPLEVESPPGRGRDWDEFNLAYWWDVESRRGRDYLDKSRETGGDFYTAITDTTTSAYEETEDLDDDNDELVNDVEIDFDPLLEMPEVMMVDSGGGGGECFPLVKVNSNGAKNKIVESAGGVGRTPQTVTPTLVVTSTSSNAGWPIKRLQPSTSLGSASEFAASSSAIAGDGNRRFNQCDTHNGSLPSVGQSLASQSTVKLASGVTAQKTHSD